MLNLQYRALYARNRKKTTIPKRNDSVKGQNAVARTPTFRGRRSSKRLFLPPGRDDAWRNAGWVKPLCRAKNQ
jgi:hypothetical protein